MERIDLRFATRKSRHAVERRYALVLSIVALALGIVVLTGCGRETEEEATERPATQRPPDPQPDAAEAESLRRLRDDFVLNFGQPGFRVSWFTPARTLTIEGDTLVARTDFYPDEEGRALANQLCNALNANYVLSNTADYGLDSVAVYAQDEPVASASGGGTC